MTIYALTITLLIFIIFISIIIYFFSKIERKEKKDLPIDYIKGLEYFVSSDYENALKYLNSAWEKEPNNIDAYLKVGDLLRIKGNIDAATTIHKNISVKPNLKGEMKIKVFKSLSEDYIKKGKLKEAINSLNTAFTEGDNSNETKRKLISLYEMSNEWENAFDMSKEFYQDKKKVAEYSSYVGLKLLEEDASNAFNYIKTGLKSNIPLASYAFSLYLFKLQKEDDGIEEMKKLLIKHPHFSEFGLEELEHKLFLKGKFSEMEDLYDKIIESDNGNVYVIGKFAELMAKKKDKTKVYDLLDLLKDEKLFPENLITKIKVLSIIDFGKVKELLNELPEILKYKKLYKCKECGYEAEDFSFKCNSCFNVDTFFRLWKK